MAPPASAAISEPSEMPDMNTAIAHERFSGPNRSEISECALGEQPASPMPTITRATSSDRKPAARPHSAVATLQIVNTVAIRRTRFTRSASRPKGMPSIA